MLLISLLRDGWLFVLAFVAALVGGLTVHEYAHARAAFAMGDATAYAQGRMTLNPRAHIDPLGALVFLIAGFGWARPVPIDPYRLGRQGTVLVALAGPASNVLLALLAFAPLRLGLLQPGGVLGGLLFIFAWYNLLLAAFNLLPVSPLDGWRVLVGVVPRATAYRLHELERYSSMALVLLILVGAGTGVGLLGRIIRPVVDALLWLVAGPGLAAYFGV